MISSRLAASAALAALVSTVAAQTDLHVLAPGGDELWWVANSVNNIVWNCHTTTIQNFTILVTNPTTQFQPLAIIAIQENFDCSLELTQQQDANLVPGSGYIVQLANPFNSTDVYAASQPFEIKPAGSTYPAVSNTPTETLASATSTGSSSSSTSGSGVAAAAQTSKPASNGASGLTGSVASVVGVVAGVLGLMIA